MAMKGLVWQGWLLPVLMLGVVSASVDIPHESLLCMLGLVALL